MTLLATYTVVYRGGLPGLPTQAKRCAEFQDLLRVHNIPAQFAS